MLVALAGLFVGAQDRFASDLAYLRQLARQVVDSALVSPGGSIPGVGTNSTGYALRVPGGTQTYYPAFWVRDAAMMLGADLVPEPEIEGWIRVVTATQPGPDGVRFAHSMRVPGYSVPDHVTLKGEACWYPGAYADQGVGEYGLLPPADDAFYFVQMAYAQRAISGKLDFYRSKVRTAWGEPTVGEACERAFDSVAVDRATGLVLCDPVETRVDWGFCDSIRKTGKCLMPSLLRWQAATRLAELCGAVGDRGGGAKFRREAQRIQSSLVAAFYAPLANREGTLLSATGIGRQDDVWGSAFAVWLGVLPTRIEAAVARHLKSLVDSGQCVAMGQVRSLPVSQYWQQASSGRDSYQNGGYWATPTGWMVVALSRVDVALARRVLSDFVDDLKANRSQGAPFEWIDPKSGRRVNGNYGSSAGLVYVSIATRALGGRDK